MITSIASRSTYYKFFPQNKYSTNPDLKRLPIHNFFVRISNFYWASMFLVFLCFDPWIILKLLLNIEGVTTFDKPIIVLKSLSMSYFVIKQNNNKAQ